MPSLVEQLTSTASRNAEESAGIVIVARVVLVSEEKAGEAKSKLNSQSVETRVDWGMRGAVSVVRGGH
jgi:hypothetical protein